MWPDQHIDPQAVQTLNVILANTGAKVVVSSTWRRLGDIDWLRGQLNSHGFEGDVVDVTPRIQGAPRGLEIQAWLDKHPEVDGFVILDDDSDMEHLYSKLLLIDYQSGLQPHHLDTISQQLSSPTNKG